VIERLELEPDDRVLEFGCGPGVAAGMVAERLTVGHITAIDRSATAIARATERNADHLASGRLVLQQIALADFRTDLRFDKAFGVNVNAFWTTSAEAECAALRAATDVVHLVYDADRTDAIDGVVAKLTREGFRPTVHRRPPALVCVTGAPGARISR
jgi:SAM-dependent methyltransferase